MMQLLMQRLILCMALSTLGAGCRSTIVSSPAQPQTQTTAQMPAEMPAEIPAEIATLSLVRTLEQKDVLSDNQYQLMVMSLQQLQQDLGGKPLAYSSLSRDQLRLSSELLSLIKVLNTQHGGAEVSNITTVAQLAQYLQHHLPMHDQVIRLRAMIQQYQSSSAIPWPKLTAKNYRLGQRHHQISQLKIMLQWFGDLPVRDNDTGSGSGGDGVEREMRTAIFDPDLIEGLKRFQRRHGLGATGQLNKATTNALNVTPTTRIRQMQTNLWRWFSLPAQLPERYLRVNIPQYQLMLYHAGELALKMPVIVGRADWPTPRLSTTLTRLTINPTWTPPTSIIRADLLPRHRQQPDFLNRQGFELHQGALTNPLRRAIPDPALQRLAPLLQRYRLVQTAGPRNALGQFRFLIVNTQAIFLHDSPAKYLFANSRRALSHGCIRLANANNLSDYLFKTDPKLHSINMQRLLRKDATQSFSLSQPLPVFITYHTSWVDSGGTLQLRPDIYHLDRGI